MSSRSSAHGSPVVLRAIVAAAMRAGARLAEPGEFTLRAFLNGRIDLTQAEAVADLIDAVTPLQARAAFDQLQGTLTRDDRRDRRASCSISSRGSKPRSIFPTRAITSSIRARWRRRSTRSSSGRDGCLPMRGAGVSCAKGFSRDRRQAERRQVEPVQRARRSSRAIVTDVPGTTRDLVTEVVDLDGLRVTLVDTAGLRETADIVEAEGVARAQAGTRCVRFDTRCARRLGAAGRARSRHHLSSR